RRRTEDFVLLVGVGVHGDARGVTQRRRRRFRRVKQVESLVEVDEAVFVGVGIVGIGAEDGGFFFVAETVGIGVGPDGRGWRRTVGGARSLGFGRLLALRIAANRSRRRTVGRAGVIRFG